MPPPGNLQVATLYSAALLCWSTFPIELRCSYWNSALPRHLFVALCEVETKSKRYTGAYYNMIQCECTRYTYVHIIRINVINTTQDKTVNSLLENAVSRPSDDDEVSKEYNRSRFWCAFLLTTYSQFLLVPQSILF